MRTNENTSVLKGDDPEQREKLAGNYRRDLRRYAMNRVNSNKQRDTAFTKGKYFPYNAPKPIPVGSFTRPDVNSLQASRSVKEIYGDDGTVGVRKLTGGAMLYRDNDIFKKALGKRENNLKELELLQSGITITDTKGANVSSTDVSVLGSLIDDFEADVEEGRVDDIDKKSLKSIYGMLKNVSISTPISQLYEIYKKLYVIGKFSSQNTDLIPSSIRYLNTNNLMMTMVLIGTINFSDEDRKTAIQSYSEEILKSNGKSRDDLLDLLHARFSIKSEAELGINATEEISRKSVNDYIKGRKKKKIEITRDAEADLKRSNGTKENSNAFNSDDIPFDDDDSFYAEAVSTLQDLEKLEREEKKKEENDRDEKHAPSTDAKQPISPIKPTTTPTTTSTTASIKQPDKQLRRSKRDKKQTPFFNPYTGNGGLYNHLIQLIKTDTLKSIKKFIKENTDSLKLSRNEISDLIKIKKSYYM